MAPLDNGISQLPGKAFALVLRDGPGLDLPKQGVQVLEGNLEGPGRLVRHLVPDGCCPYTGQALGGLSHSEEHRLEDPGQFRGSADACSYGLACRARVRSPKVLKMYVAFWVVLQQQG